MTLVPMRFKSYEWRYNPEEISFECEKNVRELYSPKGTAYVQNLGRKNRLIKGKGQLCGEDCHEQFEKLWEVFAEGTVGVLALPFIKPVYVRKTDGNRRACARYAYIQLCVQRNYGERKGGNSDSVHCRGK